MAKPRITFRKGPIRTGRMALQDNYHINLGQEELGHVQRHGSRLQFSKDDLWFWYGDGQNSAHEPKSLEEVKADVIAYFKPLLERRANPERVCADCGLAAAKATFGDTTRCNEAATWSDGKCDVCWQEKPTTESRDFGRPNFALITFNAH